MFAGRDGSDDSRSVDSDPELSVVDADLDARVVVVAFEVDANSIPRLVLDLGSETGGR